MDIDVHIIHLPNENKYWWEECERSLEGHPINIFHVEGKNGDILYGRKLGYSQGNSQYVSFVDPDDIVYPGAFAKCLEEIDDSVCGVYTMSDRIENDNIRQMHPYEPCIDTRKREII